MTYFSSEFSTFKNYKEYYHRHFAEFTPTSETGEFDWSFVKSALKLSGENKYFELVHYDLIERKPNPFLMESRFDLLEKHGCKDVEVFNALTKELCRRFTLRPFEDLVIKARYGDVQNYPAANPCFEALLKGCRRGLKYLLQNGLQYFGPRTDDSREWEICCIQMSFFWKGKTHSRPQHQLAFMENTVPPEKKHRFFVAFRALEVLIRFHQQLREGTDKLWLEAVSGKRSRNTLDSNNSYLFKGDILDPKYSSRLPKDPWLRRDIVDWIFSIDHFRCFRMVYNTIPEPIVSLEELKPVLHKCLVFLGGDDDPYLHKILKKFSDFVPESLEPVGPRSLRHLCKCQVRQNIRESGVFPNVMAFSEVIDVLSLPPSLKDYIRHVDDSKIHK